MKFVAKTVLVRHMRYALDYFNKDEPVYIATIENGECVYRPITHITNLGGRGIKGVIIDTGNICHPKRLKPVPTFPKLKWYQRLGFKR